MGNEVERTTITIEGREHAGSALLETDELLLRIAGEPKRRRVPIASMNDVSALGDRLRFQHEGQRFEVVVPSATRWAARITSPPTLLDKLGIVRGSSVHVRGLDDDDAFVRALDDAAVTRAPLGKKAAVVVVGITTRDELAIVKKARASVGDALVLWIAYPKGKKELSEDHVRATAIAEGLVDVKVARFSALHSALKLVVRKSERGTAKRTRART